jgi:RNA-binding protein AU-1
MRVRIRGIYTTALTYLFLKSGYTIVQQTPQIVERFGIDTINEPADVTIKDGVDKGEIVSIGEDIYNFLRSTLKYSSIWKSPVKLYSVIEPKTVNTWVIVWSHV